MKRIILDTDLGTDIDDAVALVYLLCQEKCNLEGITTVTGEPEKRAMIADAICRICQKNIPIHSGFSLPMSNVQQRQKIASHAEKLYKFEYNDNFPSETAYDFLLKKIKSAPGELTLLTIGPLTNIGRLFQDNPEIPKMLKGHYIMGGAFYEDDFENEWNILCDPDAAKIVFDNPAPNTKVFGLNVTQKVVMDAEKVREKFNSPVLKPILEFAEVFFQEQRDYITFHDPLAAAAIFDEKLCKMEKGTIKVDTQLGERFGATYWTPDQNGNVEIAVKVDSERFFSEYFSKTLIS